VLKEQGFNRPLRQLKKTISDSKTGILTPFKEVKEIYSKKNSDFANQPTNRNFKTL